MATALQISRMCQKCQRRKSWKSSNCIGCNRPDNLSTHVHAVRECQAFQRPDGGLRLVLGSLRIRPATD